MEDSCQKKKELQNAITGNSAFRPDGIRFIWHCNFSGLILTCGHEPGISNMHNNLNLSLNLPIAMVRNRPQSITDLETQQITGEPRNGDAAFADYLVNFSVAFRIGGSSSKPDSFNCSEVDQ